ncbi:MAG: TrmH family RNA methyltransferase [Lachnospiraceae bacterium]
MITSTSNSKIKNLTKCMKNAKERRKQDIFLVEGIRMFSEIPKELHVETFATEEFFEKNTGLFADISYELVTEHIMQSVSDTKTPQGVISLVKRQHYSTEDVCQAPQPLIMALENIQDPGNLGTILRTAEGAGVTGILMSRDTVDIYNPKVVRATMGSIFRIPFCYVDDLTEFVTRLNGENFETYSAHLQGTSFYDFDYRNPTIFCIGNEGNGLSRELSNATKYKIKIPMMGKVESLNAATAATVLMYEAMRQRNSKYRQN